MTSFIEESGRQVPVVAEADVVVVGGGTAGVVAALASAKTGAHTMLVESAGHLGGTLLGGGIDIQSFFNCYAISPHAPRVQVVRGTPQEIVDRMVAAGGSAGHLTTEIGASFNPVTTVFDPEILKRVLLTACRERGVTLYLRTLCVGALVEDARLTGVLVENKSGRGAILAKRFVDASGDGDLAARAGAEFIPESAQDRRYPVGLIFGMGNIDPERACSDAIRKNIVNVLARGDNGTGHYNWFLWMEMRRLPGVGEEMAANGLWAPAFTATQPHDAAYINCTSYRPDNALDTADASAAEEDLYARTEVMARLLCENIAGFENAYINSTAPILGVRRTRTILAEYNISRDDVLEGRGFDDDVARFSLMDFHRDLSLRVKDGGSYGIPYRALLPRQVENLLLAGRMITSDWTAHMSTRMATCCMAQGEAAGTAAALSARMDVSPRKLDVRALQRVLIEHGVYLEQPLLAR